ncbi:hypothetical protein BGZ99_008825 [Dissophora globulifera]|uniref:C2H2-type domain-containing protein n=1 Tax=Dissophora globulifera TaxID=979702 RepID=A0A9P6R6M4_9FUNG|nr:hypothetical protein BGZ99_008825 [Dissophora globulifera]
MPKQADRQPHKQQQQQQQQQHQRQFGAPDAIGHQMHDSAYSPGSGYMGTHGVASHDRSRVQTARHPTLARNLMDYSDSYNAQGQGSPLGAAGAAAHHTGMVISSMPLLPAVQLLHSDAQAQPFQPLLLNTGAGNRGGMATSLDSVQMGLGSPAILSHPDYGTVASYMPTPQLLSKSRSLNTGSRHQHQQQHQQHHQQQHQQPHQQQHQQQHQQPHPQPPAPPQRSQSIGGGMVQASGSKTHRTRTSSLNSASSVASNGIVSSITSTLNATNISFPESRPSSSSIHAVSSNNNSNTNSGDLNIAMPAIGSGACEDMDESNDSASSQKPRAGGAPRKAIAARVFECSFPNCNKAYTQLHNLKSHERTGHTPIQKPRPFLCIIQGCAKAFSQRKSLALHIRASHKEYKFKPFKCSQANCYKAYTQLHNLRTHEKTVHMLDLSRKRVRNPSPSNGPGTGGEEETGMGMNMGGAASGGAHQPGQQHIVGAGHSFPSRHSSVSHSSYDRNQLPGTLNYESVDESVDYRVEMRRGNGPSEEGDDDEFRLEDDDGDDDYIEE